MVNWKINNLNGENLNKIVGFEKRKIHTHEILNQSKQNKPNNTNICEILLNHLFKFASAIQN